MDTAVSLERARQAKRQATLLFEKFGKVVGTGIINLDGGYGIKINLLEAPPADLVLPDHVEGVPVQVEFVGNVFALGKPS